jgi:hypothetical protein
LAAQGRLEACNILAKCACWTLKLLSHLSMSNWLYVCTWLRRRPDMAGVVLPVIDWVKKD